MHEGFWRWTFLIIYLLFMLIRSYYSQKALESGGEDSRKRNLEREGKIAFIFRGIVSNLLMISIILYVISPEWLSLFKLNLPGGIRWAGVLVALMSLPLLKWIHDELGRQYSPHLELKEQHQLIKSGPYTYVRHPMYSILDLFMLGICLVASNLVVFVPHLLAIVLTTLRLKNEEKMLTEEFGQEYLDYKQQTGKLIPKLKKSSSSVSAP